MTPIDLSAATDLPVRSVVIEANETQYRLPCEAVGIRRSGLEFHSPHPIPTWTEMHVDMNCDHSGHRIRCSGVVVDCQLDPPLGYLVSLAFISPPKPEVEAMVLAAQ